MGRVSMIFVALAAGQLAIVSQVAAQCSPSPCGVNTNCEVNRGGAAVCRYIFMCEKDNYCSQK